MSGVLCRTQVPGLPPGTLEDDEFFYVPAAAGEIEGADLIYLPGGVAGLAGVGGLFSKISKSVKKVVKKAGEAVSKVAKKVAEPVKKVTEKATEAVKKAAKDVGKVVKTVGEIQLEILKGMVGLGVPLPIATDMAAGIQSAYPGLETLSQAEIDDMARQAAAKYQAGGGQMDLSKIVKPAAISLAAAGAALLLVVAVGALRRRR